MTRPSWMWLKATWWVAPILLGIQVFEMSSAQPVDGIPPGWRVDWSWMLSLWNGATLLLSPAICAITVALIHTQMSTPIRQALPPTVHHWRVITHITTAVLTQALTAQALTLALATTICLANSASPQGLTLPWQLLTGPCAAIAAATLGAAIAVWIDNPWAIPGSALGVFLAHRIFFWRGYPELFTLEGATWIVDGRPIPTHLAATVALNLLIATALAASVKLRTTQPGQHHTATITTITITLLAALAVFLPFVLTDAWDTYEPHP